jgi:hypothetical protein
LQKKKDDKFEDKVPAGRKSKRLKREKVTKWGEVEVEDEMDVRGWLLKDSQDEDNPIKKKEDNILFTQIKKTEDEIPNKRMKQLELDWKMHMHPGVDEPAKAEKISKPKVKITKKDALKKAAENSRNIMDWIKPQQKKEEEELMDWSEDKSIPRGESIITIERKETARMRKEAWMTNRMCREDIEKLISHVEGRSVAGTVVTHLVDRALTEGSRTRIWDILEADDDLNEWTKRKLELEDARVQAEVIREERML